MRAGCPFARSMEAQFKISTTTPNVEQQTPKYNTFGPNIFSTAKRILKWKTHLRFIEEAPLRFPETLKKFNLWWRNMKICLDFGFVEGFRKILIGFGWSTREEIHVRVRPKSDEDDFQKMGIHCLLKTSINRSTISNELWKIDIFWDRVKAKWEQVIERVPLLSNVFRVRCFVGFRFHNFKFQILVFIKLRTCLLTWRSMATNREN